ncbi:MAG TPA: acyl-CoA desaturase [Thermomicrobiales bacterium]|nr:acyl-CoA desaturase [Thermomicrobiales bacterium]
MTWLWALAIVGAVLGIIKIFDRKVPGSLYKAVLVVWAVGPLIGTVWAMVELWQEWLSWTDVTLFVVFYLATGMGITLGFHRLLTHRSFETPAPVRAVFLILGCMANQGRPVDWAANHLKHHAFSDEDGDPHSPVEGFFHAHLGWFFKAPPADRERYTGKLLKDPLIMFIDRTTLVWLGLGLVIPYLIGGWSGLLWGGAVRMAFVSHATFAVNSICHTFGARPFDTSDESRNNWIIAMLTFGEGWHNNHHAFPGMAYHGMGWRQFDPTAVMIKTLKVLGLARNIKQPQPELVERRLAPKPAAAAAGD